MFRLLIILLGFIMLSGCAKITNLEGGDKDTRAPQMDSLRSTPLMQTNFRPKSIRLEFDEWIKLNDVFKNVLVSPPLKKRPKVTLKKKTVIFEFDKDEILRDSTTYTINFGSAIVDITQGNAATGLTYVFSTGPQIDSLSIRGKVLDAFTQKPVENVNIMLYDVLEDSIVYKEKPYYFAVSNKAGQFRINNIKPGTFKAFALKDGDFDFKFSQFSEPMAFLNEPVVVSDSTSSLTFLLSTELAPLKLKGQDRQSNGIRALEFNRAPKEPSFMPINIDDFYFLPKGDSIKIWYSGADSTAQLVVLSENKILDTISLKPKNKLEDITAVEFKMTGNLPSSLLPQKPLELQMNLPIASWDKTLIVLSQDTLKEQLPIDIKIKKDNPTILEINYPWQGAHQYHLNVFPKGIKSFTEKELKDTLSQKMTVVPIEKLGNVFLTLTPPDSTQQYVVRLLQKKTEIAKQILAPNERKTTWKLLRPGDYTLELIEDNNKNGIWDSGNYLQRQQPERVFVKTMDQLRANWDLEVEWKPIWSLTTVKSTDK